MQAVTPISSLPGVPVVGSQNYEHMNSRLRRQDPPRRWA